MGGCILYTPFFNTAFTLPGRVAVYLTQNWYHKLNARSRSVVQHTPMAVLVVYSLNAKLLEASID